jgi:hypothetical protein
VTRERLDAIRIVLSHGGWLSPDLAGELLAAYEAQVASRETLEAQLRRYMFVPNIPGGDR